MLPKKRTVAKTKVKKTWYVEEVIFDQTDATPLKERLALAFAEIAYIQDERKTLDDESVDQELTHYEKFGNKCDAASKNGYNATAKFDKNVKISRSTFSLLRPL